MPVDMTCSSPLLALPLELREQIYQYVFLLDSKDVRILRTCRQVLNEAQPFIFKRPLTFASQYELYEWLEIVGSQHLHHVIDLQIRLADVDLSQVLKGSLQQPRAAPLYVALYKQELENIAVALQKLPNIVALTIDKPKPTRSHLFQDLYVRFLRVVVHHWPDLRRLTLNDDEVPLPFVQSFSGLRYLCCAGNSTGKHVETAKVFSSMTHLAEVEFVLGQRTRACGNWGSSMAAVVSKTRALTSLTLSEPLAHCESSAACSLRETMEALYQEHSDTLQDLRIILNRVPDPSTLELLFEFLAASSVKHLELLWPDQTSSFVKFLPPSLEVLDVAIFQEEELHTLKNRLQARRHDLPMLYKLYVRHYSAPVFDSSQTMQSYWNFTDWIKTFQDPRSKPVERLQTSVFR